MRAPITDAITPMEGRTILLSAAIVLMDGFYNGEKTVIGETWVTLKEGVDPLKKADALYAAVDLTAGTYQTTIRAKYYNTKQMTFEIPAPVSKSEESKVPKISITLDPSPAYPFPEKTTLLRGRAVDAESGLPLGYGQAFVKCGEVRKTAPVNSFGQFVFFFESVDAATDVPVEVTVLGYLPGNVEARINPGEATLLNVRMNKIKTFEREPVQTEAQEP